MNSIPVDQYDAKTGRWLATYLSITEASLLTGYSVATISKAIRGDLRTEDKKQYIFRSPKVEYKPKPKSNMANYKGKPVKLYEENGAFVGRFDNCKEAARYIGVSSPQITYNLQKKTDLIKKRYYLKYANY